MANINKSPAFQFYVQDFLSGVKFFTTEETGAYILLLCEQWDSGFIENNEKILKKITGISQKKLIKVLEKFDIIENKFINKRLEEERVKKEDFLIRASKGGQESARKRSEEKARLLEFKNSLESKSSSSTSSSTSIINSQKSEFNFDFVESNFKIPFESWIKYRKDRKKPFTIQASVEAAYKELKELSENKPLQAIEIVQKCISNEYLSLCKSNNFKDKNNSETTNKLSYSINRNAK